MMVIKEFGVENNDIAIMLHGGGLSWWNYKEASSLLVNQGFHVVLPILDGHAQSDKKFVSIEDNAKSIIAYIDKNYGGHVKLITGLSLGGQILVEILSQRKDICEFAVIESTLVIPMKMTNLLLAPTINMSFTLIKKQWFSKMQFKNLKMKQDLYADYYRDTCSIKKNDMISFLKANSSYHLKSSLSSSDAHVLILVGKKEQRKMILSARKLHQIIKDSTLIEYDGWYHGEASINHADQYVQAIQSYMHHEEM